VHESARWLIGIGEFDRAVVVLKKISRTNRRNVSEEVYDNFKVMSLFIDHVQYLHVR
jgi:hypothetical protein